MTLTTSRKCPQCGNEVSATARFCAECGSSMTPTPTAATPPAFGLTDSGPAPFGGPKSPTLVHTDHHPDNTQRLIMGVLIGAVILLSIMVAVLAATLRHTTVATAQPCVAEPSPAPTAPAGAGEAHLPSAASISPTPSAPPVTTPATPTNPTTSPTAPKTAETTSTTASASAPATTAAASVTDVSAYIKFLQGIDERRVALMGTPESSADGTQGAEASQAGGWQGLISEFQNHTVPDACSGLADEYMTFLADCQTAVSRPADQSPQLASEAARVDGDLAHLCATQQIEKPFTISVPSAYTPPAQ